PTTHESLQLADPLELTDLPRPVLQCTARPGGGTLDRSRGGGPRPAFGAEVRPCTCFEVRAVPTQSSPQLSSTGGPRIRAASRLDLRQQQITLIQRSRRAHPGSGDRRATHPLEQLAHPLRGRPLTTCERTPLRTRPSTCAQELVEHRIAAPHSICRAR